MQYVSIVTSVFYEKENPLDPYLRAISIYLANSSNDSYFDGKVIVRKHVSTIGRLISLSNFTSIFSPPVDVGSMLIPVQKQHRSIKSAPS